jgi:hypothetical protein
MAKDAPGMRGNRSRNETGELRQKRGDTLAGTIERQYDVDLGVRSDCRLDTLRERTGETSIQGIIRKLAQ